MALDKIDELTELLINRGWVKPTKRVRHRQHLYDHTQLLMITALKYLGNRRTFCQFKHETAFSVDEHRYFSHLFTKKISSCKDELIKYPDTIETLCPVLKDYKDNFLRGCGV